MAICCKEKRKGVGVEGGRRGAVSILLTRKQRHRKASSNRRNLSFLCTCEGVDCGDVALLPSSSCCHGDSVLSPGVEPCQGSGGNIFGHCQLKQEVNLLWLRNGLHLCVFYTLYLSGDSRRGCAGDPVMVNGTLDHTPHQRDGVVRRSCHSEIHGHVQTYESGRHTWPDTAQCLSIFKLQ